MSSATPSLVQIDPLKAAVPVPMVADLLGLGRRGRSLQCPHADAHRHGDRTFSAWIASTGRSWRCYTCGAWGSTLDLLIAVERCSFQEAIQRLARCASLPPCAHEARVIPDRDHRQPVCLPALDQWAGRSVRLPAPPRRRASPEVERFLARAQASLAESAHALMYLTMRSIPLGVAQATGVGFAPRGAWPHARGRGQSRIVAPLTTPDGTLLTLYGRSVVPCDKNLRHDFLPGPRGLFHAPALTEDGVMLVEGVFDALAGLAGGRPTTAMVGLTMREEWWSAIPARSLILAVDNDAAGRHRWEALAHAAVQTGKTIYVLKAAALEGCKDMNEYWVAKRQLPASLRWNIPNRSPIAFAP